MDLIAINDPQYGLIEYNLSKSISTTKFLAHVKSLGLEFNKYATLVINNKRVPGYSYDVLPGIDKKSSGWAYVVSIDNKVAKIGQTDATLTSRFSSYQAGTRKNREKGTCSVTNWYCSEVWRKALSQGSLVEVYIFSVPTTVTRINVMGKTKKVRNKHAYIFEHELLNEYQKLTGSYPVLSNNNSEV
jgi:hypothetical protein